VYLIHKTKDVEIYQDKGKIYLKSPLRTNTYVEVNSSPGTNSGLFFLNHYVEEQIKTNMTNFLVI
jgi:hypothetical protein